MSDIDVGSLNDAFANLPSGKRVLVVTGLDSPFGSLTVQDLPEKQVQEGNVFSIRRIITIPVGISNVIFDPTAIVSKNVGVRPPVFTVIGGNYVTGTLYVGSTHTGGTPINGANRNQNSLETADSIVVELPATIPVPGTLAPIQWLIPVPTTPGVATSSGGQAGGNLPFIINTTLTQRIEFNNTDTSPAILEYNFTWSEKEVS